MRSVQRARREPSELFTIYKKDYLSSPFYFSSYKDFYKIEMTLFIYKKMIKQSQYNQST